MLPEADSSYSRMQTVDYSQAQSSKPKLFDFGGGLIKQGRAYDAKTSLAARRKRSEIRRFKLMAGACDETAEPLSKKAKGFPVDGLQTVSKIVSYVAEGKGVDISTWPGRCHPDDVIIASSTAGAVLPIDDGSVGGRPYGLTSGSTQSAQEQTGDEDDGGVAKLNRSGSVPCGDAAIPGHCVISICGRSREMQDAAIAVPSFLTLPSGQGGSVSTNNFHFYGVFDGHGGHQAADICKERMPEVLAEGMSAAGDGSRYGWVSCMESCFQRLDGELCGTCPHGSECPSDTSTTSGCREPLVPGSVGTTAVVAVVGSDDIVVGNCGDSRAVLCRSGQAVPLSFDHKASRPDEVARIEAAGGCVFNWEGPRVCGVLAMSRALGDSYLKPYVTGLPEVTVTARSPNDECLILASDGLWDVLSNEFACNVARKVLAGWHRRHPKLPHCNPLFTPDPKQNDRERHLSNCGSEEAEDSPAQVVAAILTKLALAKQSKDNISVVVVDLRHV